MVLGREMAITKEKKQEIIGTFGRAEVDTGSPEVQVALLTARINDLTGSLQDTRQGPCQPPRAADDGLEEVEPAEIFAAPRSEEVP